jgi:nucleotide-binding universal stress UspA family protein
MKKILVCLDGSARAAGVLHAATRLATATSAQLLLFRAVGVPLEVPTIAWSIAPAELELVLQHDARAALEALAREVPPAVPTEVNVRLGVAWHAICETASGADVDLIVIGAHGYGVADRILGTTAAKVVDHADRTVMVVRAPERL